MTQRIAETSPLFKARMGGAFLVDDRVARRIRRLCAEKMK